MIKKLLFIFSVSFLIMSCGSSRNTTTSRRSKPVRKEVKKSNNKPSLSDKIVWTAVTYKGVPYRYGGTNKNGMDCSGLIHTSFKKRNVTLPRTSRGMYTKGYRIPLREVRRGDLLFFTTVKKKGRVNHVGLVTSAKKGDIQFIHSTSSRGVIVTSLNESYWKRAFITAKRVLDE